MGDLTSLWRRSDLGGPDHCYSERGRICDDAGRSEPEPTTKAEPAGCEAHSDLGAQSATGMLLTPGPPKDCHRGPKRSVRLGVSASKQV